MATRTNRIYATAYGCDGTPIRLALNPLTAIDINERDWATGVTMVRCWFGRNRIVTESYSIWDDGRGGCTGTIFDVIEDIEEILRFCARAEIGPPNWIEAEEA